MRVAKWMLFLSLCLIAGIGVVSGISTPSQVQAKAELRQAEHAGRHLFHSAALGTKGLSCDNCHVDGGRFSHRLGTDRIPSLVSVKNAFPMVFPNGRITTLESQINQCLVHRMGGHALPASSRRMALLELYIRHLSHFHER